MKNVMSLALAALMTAGMATAVAGSCGGCPGEKADKKAACSAEKKAACSAEKKAACSAEKKAACDAEKKAACSAKKAEEA